MELKQTFESITPVYTWDAWMEGGGIRASWILWSLRFWFELFLASNNDYKKYWAKDCILIETQWDKKKQLFQWNLVEFIFGKDGWKCLVNLDVKEASVDNRFNDIKFTDKQHFDSFKNKNIIPTWYIKNLLLFNISIDLQINIKQYYLDKLKINNFECLLNDYFKFLDFYWFVWGKSELWFGKIVMKWIEKVIYSDEDQKLLYDFSSKKLSILKLYDNIKFDQNWLENYLSWKVESRNKYRNENTTKKVERHYIFWSTSKDCLDVIWVNGLKPNANGSKLLPIFRDWKLYLLSIVFIKNLSLNKPKW